MDYHSSWYSRSHSILQQVRDQLSQPTTRTTVHIPCDTQIFDNICIHFNIPSAGPAKYSLRKHSLHACSKRKDTERTVLEYQIGRVMANLAWQGSILRKILSDYLRSGRMYVLIGSLRGLPCHGWVDPAAGDTVAWRRCCRAGRQNGTGSSQKHPASQNSMESDWVEIQPAKNRESHGLFYISYDDSVRYLRFRCHGFWLWPLQQVGDSL